MFGYGNDAVVDFSTKTPQYIDSHLIISSCNSFIVVFIKYHVINNYSHNSDIQSSTN